MKNAPIALDYQASTPCSQEVVEAMEPYWNESWANPSSRQHRSGLQAAAAVSVARDQIAQALNVQPKQVIFTSGATEANNLSILGYARKNAKIVGKPGHLITVKTEHQAVLDPLKELEKEGFSLTKLDPNNDGIINESQLENALQNDTILVSIMTANNEIGVLQPIQKLAALCRNKKITFHSDAAQAFGNIHLDPNALGIDLLSISSHKIYGPKGIGALIKNESIQIEPLIFGGGQEEGLRSGTLPVPLIVGFAKAVEIALRDLENRQKKIKYLRDHMWLQLQSNLSNIQMNGCHEKRLSNNLNITISGVKGVALHRKLRPIIQCSSGSACSSGKASHVLLALGHTRKEAESSIRLSLGKDTSQKEIDLAIKVIIEVVNELRDE